MNQRAIGARRGSYRTSAGEVNATRGSLEVFFPAITEARACSTDAFLTDALAGSKSLASSRVDVCMTGKPIAIGALLLVCSVSSSARADPTTADDTYGYIFGDDILAADPSVLTAVPIHVQKHLHREVLLRPRVQFVTQMLKSVEAL
jgi:hypothetical protein